MADVAALHVRAATGLGALGLIIGAATIPSIIAYQTHSLALTTLMFWAFIPAIYFFIGPCMALVLNLAPSHMRSTFTAWSVLVGNVFNLIVAPQFVGILSDWSGGAQGATRHRCASHYWCLRPRVSGRRGTSSWPRARWIRT